MALIGKRDWMAEYGADAEKREKRIKECRRSGIWLLALFLVSTAALMGYTVFSI